jgi:hypothetical protein
VTPLERVEPSDQRIQIHGRPERDGFVSPAASTRLVLPPIAAEVTDVARRALGESDVRTIVADEIAELERDAAVYRARNEAALLADLEARIGILQASPA